MSVQAINVNLRINGVSSTFSADKKWDRHSWNTSFYTKTG